jgi:FkbM family methyltransferase
MKIKWKNLFISEEKIIRYEGYSLFVYPKKQGIHYDLFLNKFREKKATELVKTQLLHQGDVVLDIGANIGYYALLESYLVGNKGMVYAVEPVTDNFTLLSKNIRFNGISNIEATQVAMGDENKTATMFLSHKPNWHTLSETSARTKGFVGVEDVQLTTIDNFLRGRRKPDIIRMDVEGYELQILKGSSETLKKGMPLLIEVHSWAMDVSSFFKILRENAYFARYVIFEHSPLYGMITDRLLGRSTRVYENLSLVELENLLESETMSPHILFVREDSK